MGVLCSSCLQSCTQTNDNLDLLTEKVFQPNLDDENQEDIKNVPVFKAVESDSENLAVSDPETLTDTELNMYASKLVNSDS